MNRLVCLCLISLLVSCSSTPETVNYFLLTKPGESQLTSNQLAGSSEQVQILLQPIQLADYLDQTSLAMQLSDHQIYYSRHNLWAENLKTGIAKALLADLNAAGTTQQFLNYETPGSKTARFHLRVKLDHFLATDQASAIAVGSYWLVDSNSGEQTLAVDFDFAQSLNQDGYHHAVSQLRVLINQLSQDIASSLADVETL